MTCTMKRKFEEVEHDAHSCLKTLTGHEKCVLKNKLLHARYKMKNYENLVNSYEAQISVAKLDVEVATSDIDLLLQELQTGKRYKVGVSNKKSKTTSTQTDSQHFVPRSPLKISFNQPSVDLSSSTKKRTDNLQESDTIQRKNALEASTNLEENAPKPTSSHGENTQEHSISKEAIGHKSATSQSSNDSGYTSPKSILKKSTTGKYKFKSDGNSSDNIRSNSAVKGKLVNEKKLFLSQDNRHKKGDESKSVLYNRCSSVKKSSDICDSRKHIKKAYQRKSRIEKRDENEVDIKQKSRCKIESQNIEPKNTENSKSCAIPKNDKIYQDIEAKKNSDKTYNKSDHPQKKSDPGQRYNLNGASKTKKDEREAKILSNTDKYESRKSQKKSEPQQKSKLNRIDKNNPITAKNVPNKDKYESKKTPNKSEPVTSKSNKKDNIEKHWLNKVKYESKIEDRSNDTTLLLAKEIKKIETTPNLRNEDFAPHYIQYTHDSPIHYSDFATDILSSVNTSYTTGDMSSFENIVAQSTPFKHSGSEYHANPDSAKELWTETKEDQLTTFIKTSLADYNRDMADLAPETITYKDNIKNDINTTLTNFKTVEIPNEKTIKINDETYSKQIYDNNEKTNYTNNSSKTPEIMIKNTTKKNVMVQIPITRVPDAIHFKDPTKKPETELPVTINQRNAIVKPPCLTISVNDAGVITIRSRSVENSNPPSPKIAETVAENGKSSQGVINSITSDLEEQNNTYALQTLLRNTAQNTKIVENPIESANNRLKNQYYFDIDPPIYNSPREADEASTHKLAVNLSDAFTLLMPPSPTYTVSNSTAQEKSNKRFTPSPLKANEISINKELFNNFVPNTFHSQINYTKGANSKHNKINDNTVNDNYSSSYSYTSQHSRNDIKNHRNITNNRKGITNNISDITNNISDITNNRSDMANNRSEITTNSKNCSYTNRMSIRQKKSTPDTTLRRTTQLITAQPLKVQRSKSTSTNNMTKDKRSKSLDEQKIMRNLKEQCNSISNKCYSSRCDVTSSKKKDLDSSSDRLVYSLYKDLRRAHCRDYVTNRSKPRDYVTNKSNPRDYVTNKSIPRDYVTNKSEHSCMYCGPVDEGHLCFYLLRTILEHC